MIKHRLHSPSSVNPQAQTVRYVWILCDWKMSCRVGFTVWSQSSSESQAGLWRVSYLAEDDLELLTFLLLLYPTTLPKPTEILKSIHLLSLRENLVPLGNFLGHIKGQGPGSVPFIVPVFLLQSVTALDFLFHHLPSSPHGIYSPHEIFIIALPECWDYTCVASCLMQVQYSESGKGSRSCGQRSPDEANVSVVIPNVPHKWKDTLPEFRFTQH